MEGTVNLNTLFFSWWYKEGQQKILNYIKHYFAYLADKMSVRLCFTTLFSIWRNDTQSAAYGSSLQQRWQAFLLVQTSRLIGFMIKSVVIVMFLVAAFFSFIFFVALLLFWLAFPIVIIFIFFSGLGLLVGLL
jgi:hypothetical protein